MISGVTAVTLQLNSFLSVNKPVTRGVTQIKTAEFGHQGSHPTLPLDKAKSSASRLNAVNKAPCPAINQPLTYLFCYQLLTFPHNAASLFTKTGKAKKVRILSYFREMGLGYSQENIKLRLASQARQNATDRSNG